MNTQQALKAVIFDFDGIIMDSEGLQKKSWEIALKPFLGKDFVFPDEVYMKYAGKRGDQIAHDIFDDYGSRLDGKITPHRLKKRKEEEVLELFKVSCDLMPFAREAVEYFRSHGLPVALCGGAPRNEIEMRLRLIHMEDSFDVIVAGSDVRNGKPHPEMYDTAARKLALQPGKDIVAFEDTQYGKESAVGAGLTCIGIPNQFSINQDFSEARRCSDLREAVLWIISNYKLDKPWKPFDK